MMNSLRSFWLAFMATSRQVQWVAQSLVVGVMALLGYYTVLQPERAAVERVQQHIARADGAYTALVQRLDDFPLLPTLQQQWDSLPEKPFLDGPVTLTERLLLPLSSSGADLLTLHPPATAHSQSWSVIVSTNFYGALTFIQQITASPQPLHIHSLSISPQQDVLHLEMQLALPDSSEETQQ